MIQNDKKRLLSLYLVEREKKLLLFLESAFLYTRLCYLIIKTYLKFQTINMYFFLSFRYSSTLPWRVLTRSLPSGLGPATGFSESDLEFNLPVPHLAFLWQKWSLTGLLHQYLMSKIWLSTGCSFGKHIKTAIATADARTTAISRLIPIVERQLSRRRKILARVVHSTLLYGHSVMEIKRLGGLLEIPLEGKKYSEA